MRPRTVIENVAMPTKIRMVTQRENDMADCAHHAARGPRRRLFSLVAVVLFVAVVSAVVIVRALGAPDRSVGDSASIDPSGGQLTVGNVTVTVPQGAVPRKTRLTIGRPRSLPAAQLQEPLRELAATPSVAIDIAFADHQQPRRPLGLQIKLQGSYVPSGADAAKTLLYTPTGKGYEPISSDVSDGVLRAQLSHLSPKILTWIDTKAWLTKALGQAFPKTVYQNRPKGCAHHAGGNNVTVRFSGPQSGWSDGRTSAVHPCLRFTKGHVAVDVTNNSMVIWPVQTSGGKVTEHTADVDSAFTKFIAHLLRTLPKHTNAILGRGESMTVTDEPSDLPLTINLTATPATQQAEAALGAAYMLIDIVGIADAHATLKTLMQSKSVWECLDASNKLSSDNLADSILDAFTVLTSTCGQKVGAAISPQLGAPSAVTSTFERFLGVLGNARLLLANVLDSMESIPRQFAPVTISVAQIVPCPSGSELADLIMKLDRQGPRYSQLIDVYPHGVYSGLATGLTVKNSRCFGEWLVTGALATLNSGPGAATDDLIVLHWLGSGGWQLYTNGGTDYSGTYPCKPPVPAGVRQYMNCA
jgi:hypothetical protein